MKVEKDEVLDEEFLVEKEAPDEDGIAVREDDEVDRDVVVGVGVRDGLEGLVGWVEARMSAFSFWISERGSWAQPGAPPCISV